jgi:pimeloyl-ACP methyl ester carboxylesterase
MAREVVSVDVPGGQLVGWVEGDGPPVLLLHGGPGLSYGYLDELAAELGAGYRRAGFQQRGLSPSTVEGPFTIEQAMTDVSAFLDGLGWEKAYLVGHSWGGHLILHLAAALPDRLLGGVAVDPLGGVGDGGLATMGAEMEARSSEDARRKMAELEAEAGASGFGDDAFLENLGLVWPAYFAVPAEAPAMTPGMRVSVAAYGGLFASIGAEMAGLAESLPAVRVALGFVAGAASPLPADEASLSTAAVIPGAWVSVVPGAGHFPWYEQPGSVRSALDRLVDGSTGSGVDTP